MGDPALDVIRDEAHRFETTHDGVQPLADASGGSPETYPSGM